MRFAILLVPLFLATSAAAQPPPREFARCPNGYRFLHGVCHTFGYRDHALRYHNGQFLRHQQPPVRPKPLGGQ